ncbi:unnamed protein product [Prunus armeniaca]|uniref:Uncharacterized protein n=1 Tax=Prunus armeniaca TaxID=36596 RepID=A0A6J5WE63_PRUAR|nr:unnamed protein product [Prunus armeniaca]
MVEPESHSTYKSERITYNFSTMKLKGSRCEAAAIARSKDRQMYTQPCEETVSCFKPASSIET